MAFLFCLQLSSLSCSPPAPRSVGLLPSGLFWELRCCCGGGGVEKSPSVLCSALHENKTRDHDFLPPSSLQPAAPHALQRLLFSEWQKLLALKYHPGFSCDSFRRRTQKHLALWLRRVIVQLSAHHFTQGRRVNSNGSHADHRSWTF